MITRSGIKYLVAAALVLLLASGCTRRDFDDCGCPGGDGIGNLKITLLWGDHEIPSGTGYYFYHVETGTSVYMTGTPEGFEGTLLAGTYRVVIFNTDMEGANPIQIGSYDGDLVEALPQTTGYIRNVDNIYAAGFIEIFVPDSKDTVEYFAEPVDMVRRYRFVIDPTNIPDIGSMNLEIGGIVRSAVISSQTLGSATASILNPVTYDNGIYSTQISVLGIAGQNNVVIEITYSDGRTERTIPVDISEELNNTPEGQDVRIVLRLPDGSLIGLTVFVQSWDESGTGGGTIG